jgi:hypothetical protein
MTVWDTEVVSPTSPSIVEGSTKAQGSKAKPARRVKAASTTRARDEATQRMANRWHIRGPIEGTRHPQASYLSLDREVFFTHLRVSWHRAVWIFLLGITRERRLKPPGPDLTGRGALAPVWSYGEALALVGCHLQMVT